MAKTIGQVRFYGDNNPNNSSDEVTKVNLENGLLFQKHVPITQLGIQTLPGTQVFINENPRPIIIGQTGIYELNVQGNSSINNLEFRRTSLDLIEKSPSAYLIIDFISER